jgi:hypothetical protein
MADRNVDQRTGEVIPEPAHAEVEILQFARFTTPGDMVRGQFLGGDLVRIADPANEGAEKELYCYALGDEVNMTVIRLLETAQLAALRRYPQGVPVTIKFLGTEKSGKGRPVKLFSVTTPRDRMPEVFAAMAESYKTMPALPAPQEVLLIDPA